MTRDIRGLIFDCDGTLVDTMPLHWQAWQVVTRKYGLDFPETRFYGQAGVPTRDIFRALLAEQELELDVDLLAKEKEEAFWPLLPAIRPIESVVTIAREHHGRLPLAVASGGLKPVIERMLEHLGILHWFDAIVTSEDVVRQKPAPDIFLEAARRIGVPPAHCRAYEDAELGLQAIVAAGMHAVDVRLL